MDALRGEAAKGFAGLVAARHELDERLTEIDQQQRQATENAQRLSAEPADLERRAVGGEQAPHQKKAVEGGDGGVGPLDRVRVYCSTGPITGGTKTPGSSKTSKSPRPK